MNAVKATGKMFMILMRKKITMELHLLYDCVLKIGEFTGKD